MKSQTINIHPIKGSSSISGYGYDAQNKVLAVRFNGDQTYHYSGVGQEVVDNLLKALSFGKFVQSNIVGKYPHSKQKVKNDAAPTR